MVSGGAHSALQGIRAHGKPWVKSDAGKFSRALALANDERRFPMNKSTPRTTCEQLTLFDTAPYAKGVK